MKSTVTLLFLAVALAATATGSAFAQGGPPPTPARVDRAVIEEVQELRRVTGELRARQVSQVAAREGGIVAELLVREGERVERGQVLVRLDGVRLGDELAILAAEHEQAQAVVAEQRALVGKVENDFAALKELAARDAANPKELADAAADVAIERARLARSERGVAVLAARKRQLEQRVSDLEPRAPFSGVVVARLTEAGAWIGPGDAMVELVSDRDLEARIDVPQAYWGPLAGTNEPIQLEIGSGSARLGESWRMVPAIRSAGRMFPLVIDITDANGLAPGMSVTAMVPTGVSERRMTVSRDALLQGPTGFYVYIARPGGDGAPHSASIAPVRVLFHHGSRAVVESPAIAPDDLVVVEGNERLYPGAPLDPRESEKR